MHDKFTFECSAIVTTQFKGLSSIKDALIKVVDQYFYNCRCVFSEYNIKESFGLIPVKLDKRGISFPVLKQDLESILS